MAQVLYDTLRASMKYVIVRAQSEVARHPCHTDIDNDLSAVATAILALIDQMERAPDQSDDTQKEPPDDLIHKLCMVDKLRYATVVFVHEREKQKIMEEVDTIIVPRYCPPLKAYDGEFGAKLGGLFTLPERYCVRPD